MCGLPILDELQLQCQVYWAKVNGMICHPVATAGDRSLVDIRPSDVVSGKRTTICSCMSPFKTTSTQAGRAAGLKLELELEVELEEAVGAEQPGAFVSKIVQEAWFETSSAE